MKTDKKSILFLGVDPGSKNLGYALIEYNIEGSSLSLKDSGSIFLEGELREKLLCIFCFFNDLLLKYIKEYDIILCLETPFLGKFPQAYFVLAQIRGVLLLLSSINKCSLFDISPAEVKKIITSRGGASKQDIKESLAIFFNKKFSTADEADACAIAFSSLLRLSSNIV